MRTIQMTTLAFKMSSFIPPPIQIFLKKYD